MKVPEEVKREYALKRKKAQMIFEAKQREIAELAPEIETLDKMKLKLAYDLSAHAFDIKDMQAYELESQEVKQKLADIDVQKSCILSAIGYPPNYLEMRYECNDCQDTGYVGVTQKKMCECLKQRILQYNYASSNIESGEYFETFKLSIFKNPNQREKMEKLLNFSKGYAQALPNPTPLNIVILGETGLGKSFTLNCIAHYAAQSGLSVIKITAYNLINSILEAIKNEDKIPNYITCDFLVIDDLGTEPMIKNITVEHLFSIINEREALGKPTAIASNLLPEQILERYHERIFSRMFSKQYSKAFILIGDDIRLTVNS